MDYRIYYTDANGVAKHKDMIDQMCYGRTKGPVDFLGRKGYVTGYGLYVNDSNIADIKNIISALQLEGRTTYQTTELHEDMYFRTLVIVSAKDMDRLDYMRNMFILRDFATGNTYRNHYNHSIQVGLSPLQAIVLCNILSPQTNFGRIAGFTTGVYSSKCFSNNITTMDDLKRFLKNPQDGRGVRAGTFEENPGKGYTSKGVKVFERFIRKNTDREFYSFGICYSFCEMKSLKDPKEESEARILVPDNLFKELGRPSSPNSVWDDITNDNVNKFVRKLFDLPKDFDYFGKS